MIKLAPRPWHVASAALAALLMVAWASSLPATAQNRTQDRPDAPAGEAQTDAGAPDAQRKHPRPRNRNRVDNLDFLFGALKAAPDAESAKAVEDRIMRLLLASGSDTADLLMTRAKAAVDAKDVTLAIRLLDAIVAIKPDYVEAWNRRATLYFAEKNFTASLQDLRQVLAREPRHFGALVGLGVVLQELGEDKRALEIFRRAVTVYPLLPRVPDMIKELTEKVEGREI